MARSSAPRSSTVVAHNPTNKKKQKKLDSEKVQGGKLVAQFGKLVYVVYNSDKSGNCAHAIQANNIQLDIGNPLLLRLSDGSASASYVQDFVPRLKELPDLDAIFLQLTTLCCIAGEHGKDNFTGLMATHNFYQVSGDDTSLIRQLATIDDDTEEGGSVVTNLPVYDQLGDYRLRRGEGLPHDRVIKLSMHTAPYHSVCIFERADWIPFQNLVKHYMFVRLWVVEHEGAEPEPHFASFHRRAGYFYGFGGERTARVFKISERFLARAFWEKSKELLNLIAGHSWHHVSWTDPNNPEEELDTFNVFVPKLFTRPVCRAWDNLSFEEIAELGALLHPVIRADDNFPDGHKLAYRVVDLNLDRACVTDGDDFLGLSVPSV